MPLPQGYLPKEGDILLLRAAVKYDILPDDLHVHATPEGRHSSIMVALAEVHSLFCRRWKPGDRVRLLGNQFTDAVLTVVAVDADEVWCLFPSGQRVTKNANDLEPAPRGGECGPTRALIEEALAFPETIEDVESLGQCADLVERLRAEADRLDQSRVPAPAAPSEPEVES